jgi:hypothetical protein
MYRKCIGSDPTAARLDFALYEVAGEWESRSGSPRVRIYRNPGRRGGGFYSWFIIAHPAAVRPVSSTKPKNFALRHIFLQLPIVRRGSGPV